MRLAHPEVTMSYPAQFRLEQKVFACPHYQVPVRVESRVAIPSDFFRESPVRIVQRTCSAEFDCVLVDKSACPMGIQQIRLASRR
ncbi:MAG: hypothetical protein WD751_05300 [Anaerolineales bacterium]